MSVTQEEGRRERKICEAEGGRVVYVEGRLRIYQTLMGRRVRVGLRGGCSDRGLCI